MKSCNSHQSGVVGMLQNGEDGWRADAGGHCCVQMLTIGQLIRRAAAEQLSCSWMVEASTARTKSLLQLPAPSASNLSIWP